jgi:transcriptional regulator with XRE-family HTH domain
MERQLFGEWILKELENRGWTQAELSRRAEIADATLSRIISGMRQAGPEAALAIARALGEPPEKIFRLAGILPSRPPVDDDDIDPETRDILDETFALLRQIRQLGSNEDMRRIVNLYYTQAQSHLAAMRAARRATEEEQTHTP